MTMICETWGYWETLNTNAYLELNTSRHYETGTKQAMQRKGTALVMKEGHRNLESVSRFSVTHN